MTTEADYVDPFEDPQLFELDPVAEYMIEARKRESELAVVLGRIPLKEDDAKKLLERLDAGQGVALVGTFTIDLKGTNRLGGVTSLIGYARDVELT